MSALGMLGNHWQSWQGPPEAAKYRGDGERAMAKLLPFLYAEPKVLVSTIGWLPSRLGPNTPSAMVSQPKFGIYPRMGRCVQLGVEAYSDLQMPGSFLDSRPPTRLT